jgi:pimeloyl-ACP methyl ester carboxylesterase
MKSYTINTDYGEIYIEEKGEGVPLLAIHGVLSSGRSFEPLLDNPPQNSRVITVDLPGHGRSVPSKDFIPNWNSYADIIEVIIDKMELSQINIIGHSMGGGIAAFTGSKLKNRVKKLILLDSLTGYFAPPLKGKLPQIPILGYLIFKFFYNEKLFFSYFKNDVFYDSDKINTQRVKSFYEDFNKHRQLTLLAIRNTAKQTEIVNSLSGITADTLIIWGANDRLIPKNVSYETKKLIRTSTIKMIEKCGHSPLEEQTAETLNALNEFLLTP